MATEELTAEQKRALADAYRYLLRLASKRRQAQKAADRDAVGSQARPAAGGTHPTAGAQEM